MGIEEATRPESLEPNFKTAFKAQAMFIKEGTTYALRLYNIFDLMQNTPNTELVATISCDIKNLYLIPSTKQYKIMLSGVEEDIDAKFNHTYFVEVQIPERLIVVGRFEKGLLNALIQILNKLNCNVQLTDHYRLKPVNALKTQILNTKQSNESLTPIRIQVYKYENV